MTDARSNHGGGAQRGGRRTGRGWRLSGCFVGSDVAIPQPVLDSWLEGTS